MFSTQLNCVCSHKCKSVLVTTFHIIIIIIIIIFMYSYCLYAPFCIFYFHRANWPSPATLTEGFLCSFLSCKANARVYLSFFKTWQGPQSS